MAVSYAGYQFLRCPSPNGVDVNWGILSGRLQRRGRNQHVADFLPALLTALRGKGEPS
jgi:hypothetical protein